MPADSRLKKEVVGVLPFRRRRGWHYYATIERDRTIGIYATAPDDPDGRRPQNVLRTGITAIPYSSYTVVRNKLVRCFDPERHKREEQHKARLRARSRAGESTAYLKAVADLTKLVRGRQTKLELDDPFDIEGFVVHEIAVPRKTQVDVLAVQRDYLKRGALVFQLEPRLIKPNPNLGVMATSDPRDGLFLPQSTANADVTAYDLRRVLGPLLTRCVAQLLSCNIDLVELHFVSLPENLDGFCAKVIKQLRPEEISLRRLDSVVKNIRKSRQLFLWWT